MEKKISGLGVKVVVGAVCMGICMAAAFAAIMMTTGKRLILNESHRLIEQTGNNIISDLQARSVEIEALARAAADAIGEASS